MSAPEIDIRWGGGTWRRSDKKYLAPIVDCAVGIARDGLDHFEISAQQPKTATVYLCGRDYPITGESIGPTEFELNFRAIDVKRKKIFNNELRRKYNVGTAFHELLHCVRSEHFNNDPIEEMIATEGIAYVGAELLLRELDLGRKHAFIPVPLDNGKKYTLAKEMLTKELLADIDMCDGEFDPLYGMWLKPKDAMLPSGVLLGCLAVSDLLSEGVDLKDIVRMDAHEILGV